MTMDLTQIDRKSDFYSILFSLFQELRPRKIIETGTYLGTGSTAIIASILKELELKDSTFFSIEVNPDRCSMARTNIKGLGLDEYVRVINGLSIDSTKLPIISEIEKDFADKKWPATIYIDHPAAVRAHFYYRETDFNVPDNMLDSCLRQFNYSPNFVLLDSAGHVGFLEFMEAIRLIQSPCYIALDDIYHVKHYKSYEYTLHHPEKFVQYHHSLEKFGNCIVYYDPGEKNVSN